MQKKKTYCRNIWQFSCLFLSQFWWVVCVPCRQESEEPDDSVLAENDAAVDAGDAAADEAVAAIADDSADGGDLASAGMHGTSSACSLQEMSEDAAESSGKDEESKADDDDDGGDENDDDDDDDDDVEETQADVDQDAVQQ